MSFLRFILGFIGLVLSVYILYIGKTLMLPFVLAVLLWYVIISVSNKLDRMTINGWSVPYWLAVIVTDVVLVFALYMLFTVVSTNVQDVIEQAPTYQAKLNEMFINTQTWIGVAKPSSIREVMTGLNLKTIFSDIASTASSLLGYVGTIAIYLLFLFLEGRSFDTKISSMFPDKTKQKQVRDIIKQIGKDIDTYLSIKTLVSFLTALLSYGVMAIIGVDFAAFWAILIFFLNYIPTIGSIIAVAFPILLTLIQFDSLAPFAITAISLIGIQFAIGNVLEPRLMGKSLNLSALVIIISLAVWGSIWGIPGMFLCVPIMVIINIILSKFETTKPIAIMLSANGKIDGK